MRTVARGAMGLFSLLFFLSGAAGLVYEVAWTRLLRLPMGNTVHSMTAVLAAFMTGLALGSALAGRWIDRRGHPLRMYALLEAATGCFCLALPWIATAELPLLRWAYQHFGTSFLFDATRFLASAGVVLVPATLMGATLPVLCRYFIDSPERMGVAVGWLYAINALGAAVGALVAGFALIPWLGVRGAIFLGVCMSLVVAAIAGLAQRHFPFVPQESAPSGGNLTASGLGGGDQALPRSGMSWLILLGYGVSGLAAMAFQIAWARIIGLVVGSSTYAFSLLVGSFILGLAIGSQIAGRFADRLRRPLLAFALAEIGIGVSALATIPVLGMVPEWMLHLVPSVSHDFARFQLTQFALIFAVVLVPTACMGACLPLVSRALLRGMEHAAATVGGAYAANTVGTILGAVLAGFVLVPWLGLHGTILAGVGLELAVGAGLLVLVLPRRSGLWTATAVVALGSAAMAATPRFDPLLLSSGAYIYAEKFRERLQPHQTLGQLLHDEYTILYHRAGVTSTVTVRESTSGERSLLVSGKADASDHGDMPTQALLGHIPCLLHPNPRDVAVIGLASGVSLHSVSLHPTVRSIDCVEIAPAMLEASRYFDHVNGKILEDPRVHMILQDGRNHLALTNHTYDVIVSEPPNPWMAGIASLYTKEFFTTCRERLRPDGMAGVFLHMYSMDLSTFRNIVHTFASVFPHVSLWETIFASDYLLLGSKTPLDLSWEDLQARLREAGVAADLAAVGVENAAEFLSCYIAGPEAVREFARGGSIYGDDRDRLEFQAPRLLYHRTGLDELSAVEQLRRPGAPEWLHGQAGPGMLAALASVQAGQNLMWAGLVHASRNRPEQALRSFYSALQHLPRSPSLHQQLVPVARQVIEREVAGGDAATAVQRLQAILALQPDLPDLQSELGMLLARWGRLEEAEAAFRRAHDEAPRGIHFSFNLALTLAQRGRYDEAEPYLLDILARHPRHTPSRLCLGRIHVEKGELQAAVEQFRAVVAADPSQAEGWTALGETLLLQGSYREAATTLETAITRDPNAEKAHRLLAQCYDKLGQSEKAARASGRAKSLAGRP